LHDVPLRSAPAADAEDLGAGADDVTTVENAEQPLSRWRRSLRSARPALPILAALSIALATARVLTVDLAGVVTNDSLGYFRAADHPVETGFVFQGYRQVAYPLLIAAGNTAGDLFGWDHIFGVALVQRSLLVGALIATAWAMRWWSVPVLLVATSSTFVVQADFVLPEGAVVPASLLVAGLAAAVVTRRLSTPRASRALFVGAIAVALLCASIKLQYTALLALPAAAAWLLCRDNLLTRRFALVGLVVATSFVAVLALAQSLENRSELGVFEPAAERVRSRWWGAWHSVFTNNPENVGDPALVDFYDEGDLYRFLHDVERSVPEYEDRVELIEDRIAAMFDAADMSMRREQFAAFVGALRGGRLDDLAGLVNNTLAAVDGDPIPRIGFNAAFRNGGERAIIEGLNDGVRPGIVTSGPLVDFSQRLFGDHRPWRAEIGVLSLAAMLVGLAVPGRHRPVVVASLAVIVSASVAMASGMTDNARYLLGPLMVSMVGGVLAAGALIPATARAATKIVNRRAARAPATVETR
jgi:hypothetical protein